MRTSPRGVLLLLSALFGLMTTQMLLVQAADQPSSTTDNAYKGCWSSGAVTIQQTGYYGSIDACRAHCRSQGLPVAGSNGDTCYCDSSISLASNTIGVDSCNIPCSTSSQFCGGYQGGLSVYSDIVSTTPATFRDFTSLGCFDDCLDGGNNRVLPEAVFVLENEMSIDSCADSCAGYKYFGVEFSRECWCANSVSESGSSVPKPSTECNAPCKGNMSQNCGSSCRINVYGPTPPTSTTSTSAAETATTTSSTVEATSTSTTTSSEATSTSTSTSSTTEVTSTSTTSTATSTSTTSTSTSTSTSTASTATSTTTSSTATTTSTRSSSSTTTTTSTKPLPTLPGTVKKLGCFNQGPLRALLFQAYKNNAANTPLLCSQTCSKKAFRYSGVEGKDCYCDNFALLAFLLGGPGQKGCDMPCPSVREISCGGKDRIEIAQDTLWKPSFINVVPSKDKH